jgi:RNA polymerase sigma factor (sigma-70 family)
MPRGQESSVLSYLRNLVRPGGTGETGDAQLLDRFVTCRDEAAFAELVRRHGPMVLGVCRRVLQQEQDVEDAFQATFLVLVRKARALRSLPVLGSWLHGVASRVAGKALVAAARRRAREARALVRQAEVPENELLWRDLRPVLDEEVERLPERFRAPFLLCYLQGKTNEEAAQELGCPKGTILSRLATARERLRVRLGRRGVTLSATMLLALLSERASAAVLPASVAAGTTNLALSLATGAPPAASAAVTLLMEGVLRAMWIKKLKTAGMIFLAVCVLAGGLGHWSRHHALAQPEPEKKGEPARPPERGPDRLKDLLKARFEAARDESSARSEEFLAGRGTLDSLVGSSLRLLEAERELNPKYEGQLAACEAHARRMKSTHKIMEAKYEAGQVSSADRKQAAYFHLDAELRVERVKSKSAPKLLRD